MRQIKFVVYGVPKPKERVNMVALKQCARCTRKTVRPVCPCGSNDLRFLTTFASTPQATVMYENLVKMSAHEAMTTQQVERFDMACEVAMIAWLPIPKSRAKKLKEGDWHTQRPDGDNICKAICDAMLAVVYADDSIVSRITIEKRWTSGTPRCDVEIREL
jgi:Holliday junction resolvase RusA-like endonuclease